mgnify:CR=1 FL=1
MGWSAFGVIAYWKGYSCCVDWNFVVALFGAAGVVGLPELFVAPEKKRRDKNTCDEIHKSF